MNSGHFDPGRLGDTKGDDPAHQESLQGVFGLGVALCDKRYPDRFRPCADWHADFELRLRGAIRARRRWLLAAEDEQLDALAIAIPAVLEEAIAAGGSSLRDFAAPDGELGYFSKTFDVYGREGEPCRGGCEGVVTRIVQGARSTFYCPKCQR